MFISSPLIRQRRRRNRCGVVASRLDMVGTDSSTEFDGGGGISDGSGAFGDDHVGGGETTPAVVGGVEGAGVAGSAVVTVGLGDVLAFRGETKGRGSGRDGERVVGSGGGSRGVVKEGAAASCRLHGRVRACLE